VLRSVRIAKRAIDVAGAAVGLLLSAPLMPFIAAAIYIDSPGPVLFRQRRPGMNGVPFEIVKFRTLTEQRDASGKLLEDGRRMTSLGRWLRRTSLDELPELFNVVRGEMSLVGPRPFVVHESEQITGWASRRLETTPGITGLWQVLGRNDIPFEEMVKLDYVYVTNWSLWWDIKILVQTLPTVLKRQGAY